MNNISENSNNINPSYELASQLALESAGLVAQNLEGHKNSIKNIMLDPTLTNEKKIELIREIDLMMEYEVEGLNKLMDNYAGFGGNVKPLGLEINKYLDYIDQTRIYLESFESNKVIQTAPHPFDLFKKE